MKIAFNTANLVGRVTGYRFSLSDWGAQHERTVAATDEHEFAAICSEIAAAGYRAIELWQAHADPSAMTAERAALWRKILNDSGLSVISYAAAPTPGAFDVCQWLQIPLIAGGMWGADLATASALCKSTGILYGYENHHEKSVAEIRACIAGSDPAYVGIAVDTGWLGTQGLDAPATLKALGPLVKHIHLKDVHAAGGHETVPLGQGVVDIKGCLNVLREMGYDGWYSWEDEPEDRNPFDIVASTRQWIEARLKDT